MSPPSLEKKEYSSPTFDKIEEDKNKFKSDNFIRINTNLHTDRHEIKNQKPISPANNDEFKTKIPTKSDSLHSRASHERIINHFDDKSANLRPRSIKSRNESNEKDGGSSATFDKYSSYDNQVNIVYSDKCDFSFQFQRS